MDRLVMHIFIRNSIEKPKVVVEMSSETVGVLSIYSVEEYIYRKKPSLFPSAFLFNRCVDKVKSIFPFVRLHLLFSLSENTKCLYWSLFHNHWLSLYVDFISIYKTVLDDAKLNSIFSRSLVVFKERMYSLWKNQRRIRLFFMSNLNFLETSPIYSGRWRLEGNVNHSSRFFEIAEEKVCGCVEKAEIFIPTSAGQIVRFSIERTSPKKGIYGWAWLCGREYFNAMWHSLTDEKPPDDGGGSLHKG